MSGMSAEKVIESALSGDRPSHAAALLFADYDDLARLMQAAAELRDRGHGDVISYSRKVFIPLTNLCRDVCHYCTFAHPPKKGERCFLTPTYITSRTTG